MMSYHSLEPCSTFRTKLTNRLEKVACRRQFSAPFKKVRSGPGYSVFPERSTESTDAVVRNSSSITGAVQGKGNDTLYIL